MKPKLTDNDYLYVTSTGNFVYLDNIMEAVGFLIDDGHKENNIIINASSNTYFSVKINYDYDYDYGDSIMIHNDHKLISRKHAVEILIRDNPNAKTPRHAIPISKYLEDCYSDLTLLEYVTLHRINRHLSTKPNQYTEMDETTSLVNHIDKVIQEMSTIKSNLLKRGL